MPQSAHFYLALVILGLNSGGCGAPTQFSGRGTTSVLYSAQQSSQAAICPVSGDEKRQYVIITLREGKYGFDCQRDGAPLQQICPPGTAIFIEMGPNNELKPVWNEPTGGTTLLVGRVWITPAQASRQAPLTISCHKSI